MKTIFLIPVVVTLVACSTISNKAANIQVHSQMSNLLTECKNLRAVTGIGKWPEWEPHAKNYLREATADKNGDTVVILNRDRHGLDTIIQGTAFRCFP